MRTAHVRSLRSALIRNDALPLYQWRLGFQTLKRISTTFQPEPEFFVFQSRRFSSSQGSAGNIVLWQGTCSHTWQSKQSGKSHHTTEGHFVAHAPVEFCSARAASYSQRASAGFQRGDRHLFVIFFGEGCKRMTSLPIFLTLWILVVFAGPSDEDISMFKVQTKREKSPKTWSLRFGLLKIKMCRWLMANLEG